MCLSHIVEEHDCADFPVYICPYCDLEAVEPLYDHHLGQVLEDTGLTEEDIDAGHKALMAKMDEFLNVDEIEQSATADPWALWNGNEPEQELVNA